MHIFTLTLLAIAAISHGRYYKKCCKSTEILTQINSTYSCAESKFKRLDVLTNETDIVRTHPYGECVDVSGDISIFNVSGSRIVKIQHITPKFFPKCCPLGYTYNSILHSCQEKKDIRHDYIKTNFVRIGLPNCKLIVDYELNETLEAYNELKFVDESIENEESYCVDESERGAFVLRVCKESIDICDHIRCIKKCCPDGQSFINKSQCFDTYTHGINLSSFSSVDNPEDPFAIISNRTCRIYMMKENKYSFRLDDSGTFKYSSNLTRTLISEDVRDTESYCIEHTKTKNFEGYLFFMCFKKIPRVKKFEYTLWPKILSCIFLVITILVYVILNETKNVFGKVLVNYCLSLFFENALLAYAQHKLHPKKLDCILRAFFLVFLSSASFTWSNVVCYDIWRTFGSMKRTLGQSFRKHIYKKMLPYFIYGWGIPTVLTIAVYLFYNYKVLPYSIQPMLGKVKCFFENKEGNYARVVFLSLPELLMQMVNIILFIKTAAYCFKIKKEINRIDDMNRDDKNKKLQKDRERLFLILKLSIIMGISFTFEVVSAFFDMQSMGDIPKYIEIVWDTVNCLQGVFIFIIFICKRKMLLEILRRLKIIIPRKQSSSSIYTQSTAVSSGYGKKPTGGFKENTKTTTGLF